MATPPRLHGEQALTEARARPRLAVAAPHTLDEALVAEVPGCFDATCDSSWLVQ